jgi:hypothetical protein
MLSYRERKQKNIAGIRSEKGYISTVCSQVTAEIRGQRSWKMRGYVYSVTSQILTKNINNRF